MVSGPRPRLKPGGDADVALRLVEGAFERLRRPLKVCDLYDEAVEQDISELLTARVSASVSRLIKFGYVEDVGRVRGIRSGGTRLVVPAGRAGEAVGGSVASWPQRVVDTILVLWAEHAAEAAGQGVLPRPVSTLELRQRLSEDPRNVEDLGRPNALPSVVRNLLKLHHPPVRTVGPRRVSGSFFVPTDVQDAQIDVSALAFSSDADRVVEATRRACMAQRRPIVTR